MEFEKILRRFLYPFYVLGLSVIHPNYNAPSSNIVAGTKVVVKCADTFSTGCYLLITAVSFIVGNYAGRKSTSAETISMVLLYSYLLFEGLLNFTMAFQAIVYRRKFQQLYAMYRTIQKYFFNQIACNMRLDRLQRRLCCKLVILWTPYIYEVFVRRILSWGRRNQLLEISMLTLQFLTLAAQTNILIHVELLNSFAAQFTQWLRAHGQTDFIFVYAKTPMSALEHSNALMDIRHFKYVHFQLWKISYLISKIFGWSMAVIILRNSIALAYSGYWLYMRLSTFIGYAPVLSLCISYEKTNWETTLISSTGSMAHFLSASASTLILINACHQCSIQVECEMCDGAIYWHSHV